MKNDRYEQWWYLFKKYMDMKVVGNDHLKKILFYALMGIVLTYKGYGYYEAGQKNSTRIHYFLIQDSGTGKSQSMKALDYLLKRLGIPSRLTTKDTEAAVVGTVLELVDKKTDTKEFIVKKGRLANNWLMQWDEGSVLLNEGGQKEMRNLMDHAQMIMDEYGIDPEFNLYAGGKIVKGLRANDIEYHSSCTLGSGSYMFDHFKHTVMHRGFLQRMFISYKKFTYKEKADIEIGVANMKKINNMFSIEKTIEGLIQLFNSIPTIKPLSMIKEEDVNDRKLYDYNTISFDDSSIENAIIELNKIKHSKIEGQYVGEKQSVLETFFHRYHLIVDKIAAQRAIVNKMFVGSSIKEYKVTKDDVFYAIEASQWHIDSVLKLFENIEEPQNTMEKVKMKREDIIIKIIREMQPKATRNLLLQKLRNLKRAGYWSVGYNKTIEILRNLKDSGIIREERSGDGNKKYLFVNDEFR